jgi:alkanesulfonate monooxygenase SsuD/methylene tetrahydromethanopterin reductase-like flavin-dependent oxidoreductase (luciferase family)
VRIGISVCSSYTVEDPREGARHMIERARAARQADLDTLFVGDHHVTPSPYFQNVPMLGRMLAEWGDKPAGALFLLPLWNPVLLAEQIGTLAAIAEGPFIMQCGLGDDRQGVAMGNEPKQRANMFEAGLTVMRTLWRGEEASEEHYWNIQRARISPLPAEPVDVWLGAMAVPAINRTARMAEGWLASPGYTKEQAREGLNMYRQACAEHDRTPTAVAIRRDIFVGGSRAEASKVVDPYIQQGYRGISEDALMYGSPAEVAEQLLAFEEMGYTDVIVRNLSADQSESLACIERLAAVKAELAG